MKDTLVIGGHEFQSRFILGSGKYSLDLINAAVQNAGAQIITLALRRANEGGTANICRTIRRPSARPRSSQTKALLSCRICTPT